MTAHRNKTGLIHFWRQPSWLLVVVMGTITIFFAVSIVRELLQGHQVGRQVKSLKTELSKQQLRQEQLQTMIDYLSSPTFQEREARLQLGLKKPGERVVVVPPETDNTNNNINGQVATVAGDNARPTAPNRWWDYFFGLRTN